MTRVKIDIKNKREKQRKSKHTHKRYTNSKNSKAYLPFIIEYYENLKPIKDLATVNELFETSQLKPTIDGPYALNEILRLIQYFGEGKHKGKVVITLDNEG